MIVALVAILYLLGMAVSARRYYVWSMRDKNSAFYCDPLSYDYILEITAWVACCLFWPVLWIGRWLYSVAKKLIFFPTPEQKVEAEREAYRLALEVLNEASDRGVDEPLPESTEDITISDQVIDYLTRAGDFDYRRSGRGRSASRE